MAYEIGNTVKYLTISNKTRTVRITELTTDEDGQQTFSGEWLDMSETDKVDGLSNEVWGYVSDIIGLTYAEGDTVKFDGIEYLVIAALEYTVESSPRAYEHGIRWGLSLRRPKGKKEYSTVIYRSGLNARIVSW